MCPGSAGPVTSDAPGYWVAIVRPFTKKLPSRSSTSGPLVVAHAAAHNAAIAAAVDLMRLTTITPPSISRVRRVRRWRTAVRSQRTLRIMQVDDRSVCSCSRSLHRRAEPLHLAPDQAIDVIGCTAERIEALLFEVRKYVGLLEDPVHFGIELPDDVTGCFRRR